MLLTITRIKSTGPIGIGGVLGTLRGGQHTTTYSLTIDELEHLRASLQQLQKSGVITWSTSPNADPSDNAAEGASVALTSAGGGGVLDHGSFSSVAGMPNGSANHSTAQLNSGDRCFLTAGIEYLCLSPGTPGAGDAVWVPNTGIGPFASVLYVDQVRGSDVTGQRGNSNRPYATPQAAINAAQTDDKVLLAAQRFNLTAALTIPATVVRVIIAGTVGGYFNDLGTTTGLGTIVYSATTDTFDFGANLGLTTCTLLDMTLLGANSATVTIRADGSAYASNTFLSGGLTVQNCSLNTGGSPIFAKYARSIRFVNCPVFNGSVGITIQQVPAIVFIGTNASTMGFVFSYDITDPLVGQFQPNIQVYDRSTLGTQSGAGSITIGGVYRLYVDQTSSTGGVRGLNLTVSSSPVAVPGVSHCGYMANASVSSLDFGSATRELPDTATVLNFDFRGCRFYTTGGSFQVPRVDCLSAIAFKIGGAGTNSQTVLLDGCVLPGTVAVTADVNVNLSFRAAIMPRATYSTPAGTGTILPPSPLKLAPVAVSGTTTPITYPCRIPSGSTAVHVSYSSDNAGSVPTNVVTSKTQTGCSLDVAANGGGSLYPVVTFP